MKTRRHVLTALPFFAAATILPKSGNGASIKPKEDLANDLATALSTEHGGSWRVTFDCQKEFVLFSKEL